MILLIDNYDSFSYNLYQLIGGINPDIRVIRNDELTLEEIKALKPSHIILSPGPGYPKDAGICIAAAGKLGQTIPTLGVCLGHQAICEAFGAVITHAKQLMHGKQSQVALDTGCPLFHNMSKVIQAARYHSLAVQEDTLPSCLKVTARANDDEIMAVTHETFPIYGVQFHPESILTPEGIAIIRNFLAINQKGELHYDS